MAKPVSEQELQLRKRARRRLIGAIVLVAAVAAVLPMVLDSEPKPTSQEINIQIPSPDAKGGFTSKIVPVPAPVGKAAPAAKPDSKAPVTAAPAPEISQKSAPDMQKAPDVQKGAPAATAPAPATEKAPEKAAVLKPGPGTFFIQVIALAEADKAKQVQQQIVDAGMRAYTEVVAAGEVDGDNVRRLDGVSRGMWGECLDSCKWLGGKRLRGRERSSGSRSGSVSFRNRAVSSLSPFWRRKCMTSRRIALKPGS